MIRRITILFFCFAYAICSCNKDTTPNYPSVQISSPYSLAIFSIPGSIQVTGHVSDSKSLTSVSVYIANSQNLPVEQTVQIPVTSNNMNISCSYILNDNHMASGEYYLTLSASNGTTTGSAFQQIYIEASPTVRTAIYAISRGSTSVNAWKIDSVFHASLSYTVSGDYSSSDINSYYQQLYIAGHDSGNVNVYSVPVATYDWNIQGYPSPTPYFTNVYCYNDAEFISYYNSAYGYVKCFNHSGSLQAVYNALSGYYPIKTFLWGGLLFIEEKSVSLSGGENLWTYYEGSISKQYSAIPGSVVAMFGYDNNHIFIFGNNSTGLAYMQLYNFIGNIFYSPISLPSAQLLSVAQVNANTYLISFSNGTIYQYTYNPNSIVSYINGITASTVRYDSINNEVLASTGNSINEYAYNAGSAILMATTAISDSVRDIRILYNK
jgi:hypothetical protein